MPFEEISDLADWSARIRAENSVELFPKAVRGMNAQIEVRLA
jgi:hypothetical protein